MRYERDRHSRKGFGSPLPGSANFLMGDGSLRFIKNTVDPKVFRPDSY
jgi:prepilin-type processing-associated H-X9-DG protein